MKPLTGKSWTFTLYESGKLNPPVSRPSVPESTYFGLQEITQRRTQI